MCKSLFKILFAVALSATSPLFFNELQSAETTTAPVDTHVITNSVMAKDVRGEYLDPVGVTDTFPSNQTIYHAVVTISDAPDNTTVRALWLSSDDHYLGEYELKSNGTRNIDFTFKPSKGPLAPGNYKVDFFVNGVWNRTMNFNVSNTAESNTTTMTAARSDTDVSNVVQDVSMAKDTKGPEKEPVDKTQVFTPNDVIHAVVRIENSPQNTTYKASWYAVDVGSALNPNSLIDSVEIQADGSRNIDFTLSPNKPWPAGTYKVEIYVNGTLNTAKSYTVK